MSKTIYVLRCSFCGHRFDSATLEPLKCPGCGGEFTRTQELHEAQINKLVEETINQIRGNPPEWMRENRVTRLIIGPGKEPSGAGVPAGIMELYESHKVRGYAKFAGTTDHRCDCGSEEPAQIAEVKEKYGVFYPNNPHAFCELCASIREEQKQAKTVEPEQKRLGLNRLRGRFR